MAGLADTSIDDVPKVVLATMDPRVGGVLSFPLRAIDPKCAPLYPHHLAYPPMGSIPRPGDEPTGIYTSGHIPLHASAMYTKLESVNNLLSPDSPDFEYNARLDAALHIGKYQECARIWHSSHYAG